MLVFSRLRFRVANDHRQLQETIPHTANSQGLTQVVWHRFKALTPFTHFSEASSTFRVESIGRVRICEIQESWWLHYFNGEDCFCVYIIDWSLGVGIKNRFLFTTGSHLIISLGSCAVLLNDSANRFCFFSFVNEHVSDPNNTFCFRVRTSKHGIRTEAL